MASKYHRVHRAARGSHSHVHSTTAQVVFMSKEVEYRGKPFGPCEGNKDSCMNKDSCPIEALLSKPDKNGVRRVRTCKDASARGRRNRRSGLSAQRRGAKGLAIPKLGSLRPGNEEDYAGLVRYESKSGAIVKPMWTAYLKAETQSELQRPIGDNRPFVMGARVQPESKDGLYAFRESKIKEVVYALAVQLGIIEDGSA